MFTKPYYFTANSELWPEIPTVADPLPTDQVTVALPIYLAW
jgi:hypothetical protein